MPNPHPDPSAANGAAAARPRTAAEDKLWRALGAQPATTAGELATAAGIGRSTTAKILARWATAGLVTRTAATTAVGAASGRVAERWSIARHDDDAASRADGDDPGGDRHGAGEDLGIASGDDEAEPRTGRAEHDATDAEDPGSPEDRDGDQDTDDQDVEVRRNPIDDGAIPSMTDAPDTPARAGTTRAATTPASTAGGDATSDGASTVGERGRRLPPGGLRGLVEDYLREHPDQAFGPSELGKKLGRSGGAVANALVKLVEAGTAVCAQAKPLRYTLAPAERNDQAQQVPSRSTGS